MKTVRYIHLILALLMVLVMLPIPAAQAAGVSVSGPGTVKIGDSFTVRVSFSGERIMGVDARLSFDSSVVSFQSGNGASAGGIVLYSDGTGNSLSTTLNFKAVAAGSASVSVNIKECYDADLNSLGGGSGSTTVTVTDGTAAPQETKKPTTDKTKAPQGTPKPTATPVPVDQREIRTTYMDQEVYLWHSIPKGVEAPSEDFVKSETQVGEETVSAFVREGDKCELVYVTDAKGKNGQLVLRRGDALVPYWAFDGRSTRITLLQLPEEIPVGFEEVAWNLDGENTWQALRKQDNAELYLFYAIGIDGQEGWFLYDHALGSLTRYAQMVVEKTVEVMVTPLPTATPKPTAKPTPVPTATPEPVAEEPADSTPLAWWLFAATLGALAGSWCWFLTRKKLEPMVDKVVNVLREKLARRSDESKE